MAENRTYGRGSGERRFHPIPIIRYKHRPSSTLFDSAHAKYPQTGVYATDPVDESTESKKPEPFKD